MYACALPVIVFILPVLLKKLHSCSAARESVGFSVLIGECCESKGRDTSAVQDEGDLKQPKKKAPDTCVRRIDMDLDHDEEMVESREGTQSRASTAYEDTVERAVHDLGANGSVESALATEQDPVPPSDSIPQRSNSRVASLRAAFEQAHKTTEVVNRRMNSNDGASDRSLDLLRDREEEFSRVKEELDREKELRMVYEDKIAGLEEEVEEMGAQLAEQDSSSKRMLEEQEMRVGAARNETFALQKQLAELKRSVSTSTRAGMEVSDGTLREEFCTLRYEVQNWVVNNFRRVKIGASSDEMRRRLQQSAGPPQLESLGGAYEPAGKLPFLQAMVAIYLFQIFSAPYLFALPQQPEWASQSKQVADSLSLVLAPSAYNRWRAITFDSLRQSEAMKAHTSDAAERVAGVVNSAINLVIGLEAADEARIVSLNAIMRRMVDLAHVIRSQQAQYSSALPSPGSQFDTATMESVSDEGDSAGELPITCATFFSLVKTGDESGDHPELRNVLVKAQVLYDDENS